MGVRGHQGGGGGGRPQFPLSSEFMYMDVYHFTSCLDVMFDLVRGIIRELVVVGWFLRDRGVDIRDGGKFVIVGGIGTNMEGVAGGGGG